MRSRANSQRLLPAARSHRRLELVGGQHQWRHVISVVQNISHARIAGDGNALRVKLRHVAVERAQRALQFFGKLPSGDRGPRGSEDLDNLKQPFGALTEGEIGLGSKRRKRFANGTSLVETVTNWTPGASDTVAPSEMAAMPSQAATSEIHIVPVTFDYRVTYGPISWLMGHTVMKMMMGKVISANLRGLAEKMRSG